MINNTIQTSLLGYSLDLDARQALGKDVSKEKLIARISERNMFSLAWEFHLCNETDNSKDRTPIVAGFGRAFYNCRGGYRFL